MARTISISFRDTDQLHEASFTMTTSATPNYGLTLHSTETSDRLEVQCKHQNGLLYMIPAERSWVCNVELRHAHVLAGFFNELSALDLPAVQDIMNRWGLSYRERELAEQDTEETKIP
jgi:hypothetical protein